MPKVTKRSKDTPGRGARNKAQFQIGPPQGTISCAGDKIKVTFRYLPQRVVAIKRITGARFDSKAQCWTIPFERLSEIERTHSLNPTVLDCRFAKEQLPPQDALPQVQKEAYEALAKNPFAINAAHLALLDLDLVLRAAKNSAAIIVVPRYASSAERFVHRALEGAYIESEKGYLLPTEKLSLFLTNARRMALSFGVEATLGLKLSEHSEERRSVLAKLAPVGSTGSDITLEASLLEKLWLTPYVDLAEHAGEDGEMGSAKRFCLRGALPYHLRALFPTAPTYPERARTAQAFDISTLRSILLLRHTLSFPLYFTTPVEELLVEDAVYCRKKITQQGAHFDEQLLVNAQLPVAWVGAFGERPGLLIEKNIAAVAHEAFSDKRFAKKIVHTTPLFSHELWSLHDPALDEFIQLAEHNSALAPYAPFPRSKQFTTLYTRAEKQNSARKEITQLRTSKDATLEDVGDEYHDQIARLYPHQRIAVKFLIERSEAFLGDDMGLGKTLSVLTAYALLRARGKAKLLLVVCPSALTANWVNEAAQWFPDLTCCALPRDKAARTRLLRAVAEGTLEPKILITHYEALRLEGVAENLTELLHRTPALLCCDESQRAKNPRSKTFEILRTLAPLAKRKVLLSGTPIPRDISDIWSQMFILDGGERFGTHFFKWLEDVAELGTEFSAVAVKKFKPTAVSACIERVQELLLRRTKEEVLSLPEKTFTSRTLELTGDQKKRYREICDELLLRVTSLNGKSFVRELSNLLEEYLRAVQIASNPRLIDTNWKGEPAKFLELDEIVEEVVAEREGKLVIWTNFLGNIRELTERYKKYHAASLSGEQTSAARATPVKNFQTTKEPQILIAVPAAGGVGITLTAAQTAVYVDKSWNAEHWIQSVDRIHRIGQKGTVSIISLLASKVDIMIAVNLARKAKLQRELLGDTTRNLEGAGVDGDVTREELLAALL